MHVTFREDSEYFQFSKGKWALNGQKVDVQIR